MRLHPNTSQKEYAKSLLTEATFRDKHTDGNRGQRAIGFLAEKMIHDLFNVEMIPSQGFDCGIDIVLNDIKIDIKTMGRDVDMKDYYVNNLFASQVESDKYLNDIYLFASYNKTKGYLDLLGWIKKAEVKALVKGIKRFEQGQLRERSNGSSFRIKSDNYEIPCRSLEPFVSPTVFMMEIGKFKPLI